LAIKGVCLLPVTTTTVKSYLSIFKFFEKSFQVFRLDVMRYHAEYMSTFKSSFSEL